MKKKVFSILLAICMAISLPVSAMADTNDNNSTSDSVEVSTLDALQNQIANGATNITLKDDIIVTADATIQANTPVTIIATDVVDAFTVRNDAVLTLGNNITVKSNTSILYADDGTINIEGATLEKNQGIYNLGFADAGGTINVFSGTLTQTGDRNTLDSEGTDAFINIEGGSVHSENSSAVGARQGALVTISGGKVSSNGDYVTVYSDSTGKVTVTNGEISANTNDAISAGPNGNIEIKGGIFTTNRTDRESIVYKDPTAISMVITGGIFSNEGVSTYLADNYILIDKDVEGTTMYEVHVHTWKDATCTTPKTCETCGKTDGDALGHDMKADSVVAPTCTEAGYTLFKCSRCEVTEQKDATTALGHDFADATCTTPKTCKTCGATEGEALGHKWSEATCSAAKTCTVCGTKAGEALAHEYEAKVTKEPTTEAEGEKTYTCKHCGATYTEKIDKLPAPVEPTPEPTPEPEPVKDGLTTLADGSIVYYENGELVIDKWVLVDTTWYYFDKEGIALIGWHEINSVWYYFHEDGKMAADEWIGEYYVNEDGAWIEKPVEETWVQDENGEWWYQKPDGSYPANEWEYINNEWYYFGADGYMETGWVKTDNTWYYLAESGAMETGWVLDDDTWYYLEESGAMQTGWVLDNNTWYYTNASGAMETGWKYVNNEWYYLSESGAMANGWVLDDDTWYYLEESGAMQTGWVLVGNTWYYLNASGAMETGWILDNGTWYYLNENGAMQTGWVLDNGTWYYLTESGAMATGWNYINNTWYYMNASGAWVQ